MSEVEATTAAKDLADAEGVDLADVQEWAGTDKVTVDDVRNYVAQQGDEGEDVQSTEEQLAEQAEPTPPFVSGNIEYEVEDTGLEEILPVVKEGQWVRLSAESEAPEYAINRDAAVEEAAVRRTTGPTNLSNTAIEYQLPGDPLLVRLRDTGELMAVARQDVEMAETERAGFGGR
jgi:pyruvate/2-oxoglutarate dehydrogenase complex dihydrolipoamide acyltransferase (E2) component